MFYLSGKRNKIGLGTKFGTGIVVFILFIVFVFAVFLFRKPKEVVQNRIDSIVDVLTPDPINQAIISGAIDTTSKEATIFPIGSQSPIGFAKRGEKNDSYFFEIKATLPEIDREEFYYNVWIVQLIPYDFSSVGEMITDVDGNFIIEWEVSDKDKDYSGYDQIVITRQEYGGSIDPNIKIAVGEFGQ